MTRTGQHQRCISALALEAMFVIALIGTPAAQAQTYTVLHTFTVGAGADGSVPEGHLVRDSAGNLYGATEFGGAADLGVVFKLDKIGETVLYSFTPGGADGAYPNGVIIDSAGNFYGTTYEGGASYRKGPGVVFKLDRAGTETVLYGFTRGEDGDYPDAGDLIRDSEGNLYGTTSHGGISRSSGVVFKLDTAGTETVLYSFGGADGTEPFAGLIRDSEGNFYGTTYEGGPSGYGVVFKLDTTGTYRVLYNFTGGADGSNPYAGLIRDSEGNLYGTTVYGGVAQGFDGGGVVFKLDKAGTETVLHTFTVGTGADGSNPYAGLIRDSAGNLYGNTYGGGTSNYGIVFKLDTTGTETVLHTFTGAPDGAEPIFGLIRDSEGNLYGTTRFGGVGGGVVFELQF
jgi:uncharacterized repeat protein (TIGR03803 family)